MKGYGNILIVDDDPNVLEVTDLLLTDEGFFTVSAENAKSAMIRLQESEFDAVLTDIVMPGISGLKLLEDIHNIEPELPVVLMTGYADLDKAVDAIKRGAFDFLVKPYKPEQLVHSIKKAVKYHRLLQTEKDYKQTLEELNKEIENLISERVMNLIALTVADRVRNPATVIYWECKRILEKGEVSDRLQEGLNIILEEVGKLEAIVKNFHEILKSKESMFRYEDINSVVKDAVSIVKKEAEQKAVELITMLSEQPLRINMEKNLFKIAILYLIRNAIEATSEGGKVKIITSKDMDNVFFEVSDTGCGIPAEDIEKIFDPFFSKKGRRFGMGLPLVKQIVTEHMGNIKVGSEPNKGTIFRLSFPVRWEA